MSDQPEPLAAILAEMREFTNVPYEHLDRGECRLLDKIDEYADRIEHAAKSTENTFGMALAIEDGLHKRDKQSAPGNAAALRVALENARSKFIHIKKCADEGEVSRKKLTILCEFVSQEIAAALAAPARNCDRFQTAAEAVAAFADHLRAWENAHGICSEYPDHPVKVPAGAFAWLFATAEGGDHA